MPGGIVARTLSFPVAPAPRRRGRRGFRGDALTLERGVDAVAKLAAAATGLAKNPADPTASPVSRRTIRNGPQKADSGSSRRLSRIAGRAWSISGGADSGSGNVAPVSASRVARSPAMSASIASIVSGRNSRRGEAGGCERHQMRCAPLVITLTV